MTDFDFGLAAGVTAILGLFIFLAACVYHRVLPPIEKPVEALGFGGLVAVGLHMIYGAFHAHELCVIVDATGKTVENSGYQLKFGDHTLEIVTGGACTVLTALYSLGWLCRRPSHTHHV
jgi:hypothetical protein